MIRPILAALTIVGAAAVACTGSDTAATPAAAGGPDGGGVVITPNPGAEGGAPTCFGKTFGTVQQVSFDVEGSVTADKPQGVRIVGDHAYFAAVPGFNQPTALFRGTFVPATAVAAPVINDVVPLLAPLTDAEDSPTVTSDESLLVFAHGDPHSRFLWSAPAAGDGGTTLFGTGGLADSSQFAGQFDYFAPYFVGSPTQSIYFSRGNEDGTAARLFRATVSSAGPNIASYGSVAAVSAPCPVGDNDICAAPVVTPDETLILFTSWTIANPLVLTIQENIVGNPALVAHPELGTSYPTWISADGCEVLTSGLPGVQPGYAKRTAE